jgi:adenine-specific DNA-methyltransferase
MAKTTRKKLTTSGKKVDTIVHREATRTNIPTAEFASVMARETPGSFRTSFDMRNQDLDPQLIWRGKYDGDSLDVHAPPLFIQEKVHPKVLIDDLLRRTQSQEAAEQEHAEPTLFADLHHDFNGLDDHARTEFYQHDANWTNRMILGDSLQVMASLAEREGLRGKVQCIYLDPPYGIKFNSNFQWSTTSRDVKDGNKDHITREPEQVKAFRDTWRDGIHSYLTYLRDRLTVARDLLHDTGSIFVQIGDENVHRVRAVMDEVFGTENCLATITLKKAAGAGSPTGSTDSLAQIADYVLWYSKNREVSKYRQPYTIKQLKEGSFASVYRLVLLHDGSVRGIKPEEVFDPKMLPDGAKVFRIDTITNASPGGRFVFEHQGASYRPAKGYWLTTETGMARIAQADRINISSRGGVGYIRFFEDFAASPQNNIWTDVSQGGFTAEKVYVVQTNTKIVERCILMATDPGDLVLDPTCGSGTTAYVAEQWGRRWITIDTSRVALALARARIMGARYPFYLLADSPEGQLKEAELTRTEPSIAPTHGNIRHGFVYQRVPHITLKSIANNAEIDVIWEKFQAKLEPLREKLNKALKKTWEEWEIPREVGDDWPKEAKEAHAEWWKHRIARQKEIDASIAAKADHEYLYDKPYDDRKTVRVAGPFTVESISPHRTLAVDHDDELIDPAKSPLRTDTETDFAQVILENLKVAGVQQSQKEDRITFTGITPWPGWYICAVGTYVEGEGADGVEKRAGIFVGPEFGTVRKVDLVGAAREAGEANFDVLIACGFNYEAHATEFSKLGRIPVLKARMNADLHMADDLKETDRANLFVIFGEPDIEIQPDDEDATMIRVKIHGVDVFDPTTGRVRSDDAEGIACWFVDTEYNEESFFVRQAYFLGANDPYKSLKTTLKSEINEEAWATLNSDLSRSFRKPENGRIAVKVINHLGDEVMKVFRV